jgi:hypothetical protein
VDWEGWSATMLPERARPAAYSNPDNLLADHYGAKNPLSPEQGGPAAQR